jgi:hypothetical protein
LYSSLALLLVAATTSTSLGVGVPMQIPSTTQGLFVQLAVRSDAIRAPRVHRARFALRRAGRDGRVDQVHHRSQCLATCHEEGGARRLQRAQHGGAASVARGRVTTGAVLCGFIAALPVDRLQRGVKFCVAGAGRSSAAGRLWFRLW